MEIDYNSKINNTINSFGSIGDTVLVLVTSSRADELGRKIRATHHQ